MSAYLDSHPSTGPLTWLFKVKRHRRYDCFELKNGNDSNKKKPATDLFSS